MKNVYSTVIFDLDGTLLDTLDDLTDAVNAALTDFGFPTRRKDEVCAFVGNGVARLMEQAIPNGICWGDNPAFSAGDSPCLAAFKTHYAAGCERKTHPYPGVCELLEHLRERGIRTVIVSNKFDAAVKRLSAHYFGSLVDVAVGESAGVRKKPAPDTVFQALGQLGIPITAPITGCVFVGDSDVDIQTARAAGIPCISVDWGFRSRNFLLDAGATRIVSSPAELERAIIG